ncbi:extracellular solute-binding protein [Candidatus Hydrogenosomobacter endosymbioticus]|uniref:Putrescine-binding periplasmic protein n=1 Tax=Candidatus Hydrogenosomobacter endosymbioticus TaxID=2558174 RepID=A0ABM7V974_9PROT|nr:extracellular solute-binding protein [Candidatus Hydrogenosomobacter endosymbioticus]BDB96342.1 putrescine-binding periplasmic protein [Candidatus Hydrogenosomobacter endosymbioticus]
MFVIKRFCFLLLSISCAIFLELAPCAARGPREVYIYCWADYVPQSVIKRFTEETGIKVLYDVFDSPEALEAKLISNSGYDVVFPSAWPSFSLGVKSSLFLKLDYSKIPNAKFLSKKIMDRLSKADPKNQYGVPFVWAMTGIGYNKDSVRALVGTEKIDSWGAIFSPNVIKLLAAGRVSLLDSPSEVFQAAFLYLGINPYTKDPKDWEKAALLIMKIRPYISRFDSSQQVTNLLDSNTCLLHGWSTYVNMAKEIGREFSNIKFVIPKEGGTMWIDVLAIPKDSPHVLEAHEFINFILRPDNMAEISNTVRAANPVEESYQFVSPEIFNDPAIFPTDEVVERLYQEQELDAKTQRMVTRMWMRIKMGYGCL